MVGSSSVKDSNEELDGAGNQIGQTRRSHDHKNGSARQ
jgi:hypothetical protein